MVLHLEYLDGSHDVFDVESVHDRDGHLSRFVVVGGDTWTRQIEVHYPLFQVLRWWTE